ncbi:hypothetical protein B0H17DRAFT_1192058 [Mycena rosella]|uniref:Uncharacterized protein n=1 Tax=Mycena rosella TaxID=1033263 RepID=A0AAD7GY27_MYCRO|nr:hypothetical protein B0H17DRAFT_1192058 [Mycena rosella]
MAAPFGNVVPLLAAFPPVGAPPLPAGPQPNWANLAGEVAQEAPLLANFNIGAQLQAILGQLNVLNGNINVLANHLDTQVKDFLTAPILYPPGIVLPPVRPMNKTELLKITGPQADLLWAAFGLQPMPPAMPVGQQIACCLDYLGISV